MIAKTVARNSFWYGIERVFSATAGVLTSIAIARTLGPDRLGPFVYIGWLLSVSVTLGSLGVPAATSKYMAEYLGKGDFGTARAIFFFTLKCQCLAACMLTVIAAAVVYHSVPASQLSFALLLTISCLPGMINAIPAQANVASENLAANVPASLISTLVYVAGVMTVLTNGWGVTGLAGNVLAMQTVDLSIRIVPTLRRVRRYPKTTLSQSLRSKLFTFSRQNLVLLVLSVVVWDRSEMLFLQYLSTPRQLAFYSVVFNITERLRVLPDIFGSAVSPSIMAQMGRDPARLNPLVASAVRYLALIVVPFGIGLAVLSGPAMRVVYGAKYLEAVPLLCVASVLAIPKAFMTPITMLLRTTENQHIAVRWTVVFAIVNLGLDFWLIRPYAAMGAVIANGVTQTVLTLVLFVHAAKLLQIRFPLIQLGKTALSTLAMAFVIRILLIAHFSPAIMILTGVFTGSLAFLTMVRLTKSFKTEDRWRLNQIQTRLPVSVRPLVEQAINLLLPIRTVSENHQPEYQPE